MKTMKKKIHIQYFSKMALLGIAFPVTMLCIIFGAYEQDAATALFGVAGYLIVMLATEYLRD